MVDNQPDIVGVVEREGITLKRDGKLFVGTCPFHADSTPSMKIFPNNNSFYCFGCHVGGDAISFIQKLHGMNFIDACKYLGIETRENENIKQRVVETFTYTDGINTYYKDRLEPGKNGRSKEFRQWSMKDGERQYTRGCNPMIYNGDKLQSVKGVIFVEGERKANLINSWGMETVTAVCLDAGSGSPWRDEYTAALKGKQKLIILPDNDEPGEKYATLIAEHANGILHEIKIVRLPGLPTKGDVIDWVRSGGTPEQFIELVKTTPTWTSESKIFQPEKERVDIESIFDDSIRYWNGIRTGDIKFIKACSLFESHVSAYVPKHINVISGYTSAGKSTMLAQMLVELGRAGASVDVFSLEDSREEKFMTMIAVMTGVHKRKMVLGKFSPDEELIINSAAAEAMTWPIRIYDKVRRLEEMDRIIKDSPAQIVCLDYVQNLFIDKGSVYERMSYAAQDIFRMATEYNKTWNILSQVSNDSVVNESDLMGLKGAGELAAIANSVMNMKKGRKNDNQHKVTLGVKKNKTFGPCGEIELHYSDCWTKLHRDDEAYPHERDNRYGS